MSEWLDGWLTWLELNPQWLGLAIFLVAFGECLAVAGLLVPGTFLLLGLAVLAGSGVLELWQTLLLAFAGGLLGDLLSWLIGHRLHQGIRGLPWLRDNPQWLAGAETYFRRYGVPSLLVGRFIGPLRPFLPMVAGMSDMPFGRFLVVSLLAASSWSVAYLMPGWAAGAAISLPLPPGFWYQAAWLALTLLLPLGLALQGSLHGRRQVTPWVALSGMLAMVVLMLSDFQVFDQGVLQLLQSLRSPAGQVLMPLLASFGEPDVLLLAGSGLVLLLALLQQRRAAIFAGSVLLLTIALALALQAVRSDFLQAESALLFAFLLILGALAGRGQPARWRITWSLLAVFSGLLIVMAGLWLDAQRPSAVLAGTLLAGSVCAACLGLFQRRAPLPSLPARHWWLLLPACLAMFSVHALFGLQLSGF
jgi:membrane protein DedA with SNARE-associated domain